MQGTDHKKERRPLGCILSWDVTTERRGPKSTQQRAATVRIEILKWHQTPLDRYWELGHNEEMPSQVGRSRSSVNSQAVSHSPWEPSRRVCPAKPGSKLRERDLGFGREGIPTHSMARLETYCGQEHGKFQKTSFQGKWWHCYILSKYVSSGK